MTHVVDNPALEQTDSCDASDLQLQVGHRPTALVLNGICYTITETLTDAEGGIVGWRYTSKPHTFTIWND